MANGKIKVSVEQVIHDALESLAQKVFDQYGIQIHSVDFGWWDVSSVAKRRMMVSSVRVDSESAQEKGRDEITGQG